MKKLFNSRFLFILASSLVVLILLILGAFYLFDDEEDAFVKSGYVLNPLSATSEKYFFDENVGYRENLSSMIEFVDVDENKVSVLKDSFIHYMDESMSFLKNGAILDLDSVKGDKVVSFYNITSESIIEKRDNSYVIESTNGDISFKNFIGRISDNKYIAVGDLSLKMAGNSTSIKGDYFEIVYVEEGIVNIENKDVKYQITAEDTFIYVGSDKVIDLGDKKLTLNGEDVLSLTSITIDGDENIEIIPKGTDEEDDDSSTGEDDTNNGDGSQGNQPTTGDDTPGNDGENDGTGNDGDEGVDGELTEEVIITLKDAKIGSTNINVTFDVINATDEDVFMLQVVNLSTGRTVDMVAQVLADTEIQVNLLTPNTKYLFMVVNNKDNGKYFQKVFETDGFGIKLEKTYATDNSLAYKIAVEEGTDIVNAKLSLYKYNEETKQNEIVTTSYENPLTGEIVTEEKVMYLSNLQGNIEGEHEIVFDELDNNTIYTAVLDEFSVASSNFKDLYNITLTSMTLKKTPSFSEMTVTKNTGEGSFDLALGNISDSDNAITSYTYMIYDKFSNELAIDPIVKTNMAPLSVKVGDGENELKNDTNYYYKVIIEYYDNEKYVEYITTDSIIFNMGNEPYVTVVPNKDLITYNQIGATIYLKDNSCLISMPGRENCSGKSTTLVEVRRVDPALGVDMTSSPVFSEVVEFDVNNDIGEIKYDLLVDGLEIGTIYRVTVKANFNDSDSPLKQEILHAEVSEKDISTTALASYTVQWTQYQDDVERPINSGALFADNKDENALSGEETAKTINKVILRLYNGRITTNFESELPLIQKTFVNSDSFSIKKNFVDGEYRVTTDGTFGLTADALRNYTDGKFSEYYTISIEAYTVEGYKINLYNNYYYRYIPKSWRDPVSDPEIVVSEIQKSNVSFFENLTNTGTVVGYKVKAAINRTELENNNMIPQKINYYVYSSDKRKLKFYVEDEDGNLVLNEDGKFSVKIPQSSDGERAENEFEISIYMDYGTQYELLDEVMTRGNTFYIGYEVEVRTEAGLELFPVASANSPSTYGLYKEIRSSKETPKVNMHIASSDADSITYSYSIKDPDNSLYKAPDSENYNFYTTINGGMELPIDIVKVSEEGEYNQFEGKLTIDGLSKNDKYTLYYKKNFTKTGMLEYDIGNYIDGTGTGTRIFDGYYNALENVDEYNFKYQIINDPLRDNKVVIKMLANEDLLERIISYKLSFKDSKGNTLNKELWELSVCDGDSEKDLPRCLSVDYTELNAAGMKSGNNETNLIKVEVTALYDNGLVGYDFKVGTDDGSDYLYCIMQDNSSDLGPGGYIVYSAAGVPTLWTDALGVSKGYYTYKLNGSIITYSSQLNTSMKNGIKVNPSSIGYSSSLGVLNPKMISVDEVVCSGTEENCNTFSFNSITPKVSVSVKAPIINGSVMNLTLSGVDVTDILNEGTEGSPKRYLYIETWSDKTTAELLSDADGNVSVGGNSTINKFDSTVRPTLKVEIDNDNPTKTISAMIDGLKEYHYKNETGIYYFNVYAYMNKNGEFLRTQLFDANNKTGYATKTYSFESAKSSDLFRDFSFNYSSSDEIYGNRQLNTKFNLLAYKNAVSFNFDLVYVLCEFGDKNCGPNAGESHIFKKEILLENITAVMEDSVDITKYDLEFGKNYTMYIYAKAKFYDHKNDGTVTERMVLLNSGNNYDDLKVLTEPSFVATREAILIDGEYGIDFTVTVNDSDRTLIGGKYRIRLLNSSGDIVGNMQLLDNSGNYYDIANYSDYDFDAFVLNKKIRIMGLDPGLKYTFEIYGDAYLNNYSENTLPGIENRTIPIIKNYPVYSASDYGVAFGEVAYSFTANSIIAAFAGGSNFDNVTKIYYTVGAWDEGDNSTISGEFVIGENNKRFEFSQNSDAWRFVIDPEGMKNYVGKLYNISIIVYVKHPVTGEIIAVTKDDVESFEDRVLYEK